jgi:Uma2 family endonuclease
MDQPSFESTTTVSQEQFAAFCEQRERLGDIYHYELLNGRIVMNPPAGWPHGKVGSNIQWLLGDFVRRRELGQVFDSSQGFALPSGDTVEPDHSFVSRERWEGVNPRWGEFLRVVPDLIVEVLSRRNASTDRGEKKAIYERNGVREYWLVDARARTLTAFLLRDGRFDGGRVVAEDERYASEVLAGLEFRVGDLMP